MTVTLTVIRHCPVGLHGTPVIGGLNQICLALEREREREYWDRCLFQSLGMSEKTRVEREREGGKKVGKIVFRK